MDHLLNGELFSSQQKRFILPVFSLACREVQVPLEPAEHPADFIRFSQVGHGVGDGVMIFQPEQGSEFGLIQFLDTDTDVVTEHEIQKNLLFVVEVVANLDFGFAGALFSTQRRQSVGHVSQYIIEIAVFGFDDFLHFRQMVFAEAIFRPPFQQFLAGIGGRSKGYVIHLHP